MEVQNDKLEEALKREIKGEVLSAVKDRALYSTDASMYQILPDVVVVPKDVEDLKSIVKLAAQHQTPILPRGSATSLAGQTVNRGIVVDFTKYFNRILSIDGDIAHVQPGVTRDQLNNQVQEVGLHFGPDPATSNRATIGGMIANNSSGTRSILYGKTIDHVISLRVLLSDGRILELGERDVEAIKDNEDIYKEFRNIIFENYQEIKDRYPKVMRRVCAYPLDEYLIENSWNFAKIFAGSEGTLGMILDAKVRLVPLPRYKNMVVAHYNSRKEAINSVQKITEFGPASVEMLDYNVLELSKDNQITKKYYENLITGEPKALLTIEFYTDSPQQLNSKTTELLSFLENESEAYAYPVLTESSQIDDALSLRKDGLGLLMGKPGKKKPAAFIEDSALPLEHLSDYVDQVEEFCTKLDVEVVVYAHASVGVLHIRPMLDLMDQVDVDKMKSISSFSYELVKKYHGSWSGEHGDGRVRSYQIEDYFGDKLMLAFDRVKNLFDPLGLMNPNIILNPQKIDENLRYGSTYKDNDLTTAFHYRKENSFEDLVHNCSGVGACRKSEGGTMCPSFRATGEEEDSTRGRANILRLAMSGQYKLEDLSAKEVKETLDLCLSCKACKVECPSNVDMAKLKSEVLNFGYLKNGAKLSEKLPIYSHKTARLFSGSFSGFFNFIIKTSLFKNVMDKGFNIDKRRTLPSYTKMPFSKIHKFNFSNNGAKKIALFADTYSNFHQSEIGVKAYDLLIECGYDVAVIYPGCCQRPLISNGFLKEAKTKGIEVATRLQPLFEASIPVLTLEPSCNSALSEDLPDLLDDDVLAQQMNEWIMPVEVFLDKEKESGYLKGQFLLDDPKKHLLHGHCHQKATYGTSAIHRLLNGQNIVELDSGCCGMAGAFGYEKNHFDLSKKIAEQSILSKIKQSEADSIVISNGFSCKHQFIDFAEITPKHFVEAVTYRMPEAM